MSFFPFRRRRGHSRARGLLQPGTKRAIVGVVLLVLAVILFFSFFSLAGPFGAVLLQATKRLFGWAAYLVPFGCGFMAWRLLKPAGERWSYVRLVSAGLLVVGMVGVLHLVGVSPDDALQIAHEGRGGGYLGFVLSYPTARLLSPVMALLIFVAALVVGVFMTFDISPADVVSRVRTYWQPAGAAAADTVGPASPRERVVAVPRFRINPVGDRAAEPAQLKLPAVTPLPRSARSRGGRRYYPPAIELLHTASGRPDAGDIKERRAVIARTLENFKIEVTMGKENVGPTVTQFTLRPDEGTKLSRITALQDNIALALAAHPIRIEAPIPNTNWVGIEIPNRSVSIVRLRELLTSREFHQVNSPLAFCVGKDVAGRAYIDALDRMPHLLVAGATNSGKSVCIHAMLMAFLFRNSPSEVRLILIDPKRVELTVYTGIPHLLTPVITDTEKTVNALKWALRQMDHRYQILKESGSRDLYSYNAKYPEDAQPLIVIIIDELADLMAKHAREVEGPIVRLSQMARAVGIHLVLATQRPSVNVLTGLIKANIPPRIAFNVASQVDSRTILDMGGAEKLLGSGDMLYRPSGRKPVRLQGGFVSEEEVRAVVDDIIAKNPASAEYDESVVERFGETLAGGPAPELLDDDLFQQARAEVVQLGRASASLLQRRLRVGYARAARLLDLLEKRGIIGPGEGNKPREVLRPRERAPELDEEMPSAPRSGTVDREESDDQMVSRW